MNLILIRGLPGSGKSTLAKTLLKTLNFNFWRHYEADLYFYNERNEYAFDKTKLHEAHKWCLERTDNALFNYYPTIVSNTFTTKKELAPYFRLAKKYDITPTVILCQNQFNSIHNVPEEILLKMKERFCYNINDLYKILE